MNTVSMKCTDDIELSDWSLRRRCSVPSWARGLRRRMGLPDLKVGDVVTRGPISSSGLFGDCRKSRVP